MIPLTAPPNTLPDPDYQPNGYANIDVPWIRGVAAQFDEDWTTGNIGPQAWREVDRQLNNTSSPLLSVDQANEQYGIQDVLKFDQPISKEHAAERQRLVQDQMRRQSLIDRSGAGSFARTTAAFAAGFADPVNLAFAVAPEMLLVRAGLGMRAGAGLVERSAYMAASGAFGNAVLTPAQAYFAQQEGREYGLGDALMDVTLGAAIGGSMPVLGKGLSVLRTRWMRDATRVVDAIHSVGEPASNPTALSNSSPEAHLETLMGVLQQKLHGLPADVSHVVQSNNTSTRMLGEVDNAIAIASTRAAQALSASVGDLSAPAARRAGFSPFGETGSRVGDTRITVGWRSNEFGTVAPRDLERMSPLTQTMVPVEETANSATWRVRRPDDGRTVEYHVQETSEGQKWSVTMAPKKAQLSKFIDERAPADLQSAFVQPDGAETRSVNAIAGDMLADPDELLRTYAGKTYRSGEQQPASDNFRDIRQAPIVGDPVALQDLAAMQQTIDEAPAASTTRARATAPSSEKAASSRPKPVAVNGKSFTTWFKGSKVVDENGAPKRVFHGTGQTFQEFDQAKLGKTTGANSAKRGFFFSDNPDVAASYADAEVEDVLEIPLMRFLMKGGNVHWTQADLDAAARRIPADVGMNIRPVYLSLKNPKIVDFAGKATTEVEGTFAGMIDDARAAGHDGVILKNARDPGIVHTENADVPSTVYVVFDPKDIRSTFEGETGTATGIGGRPVPQILGEATAITRELDAFAAQDDAVLQELRAQGRLTAEDEAQFEQVTELENQYKELADARARAVTCFMMEGNVAEGAAIAAAAPVANKAGDIKELGRMGGGITDAMYDNLYRRVEAGKITENGQKSGVLQAAKFAREGGALKTQDEFRAFAQKFQSIRDSTSGADYQTGVRQLIADTIRGSNGK